MVSSKVKPLRRTPQQSDGQRIDMDPLNQFIGHALQRARVTVFATINKQLKTFGLSGGEFGVLVVIQRNPGLRFIDVTRALGFRDTNFAPLIRGLEQRHLVVQRASKSDKRTKTLELTPSGEQLITAALKKQTAYEQALAEQLGRSRARLLLQALRELAREESLTCE